MQSKTTIDLYDELGHIAQNVEKALSSPDFRGIETLLADHQTIINQLSASGHSLDPHMKPVIEEAEKNVRSLILKIKDMQNDIKAQLSTMNKKKLIHSAYHV